MNVMTILYPNEESLIQFKKILEKYEPSGLQIHDYEILSIALANQVTSIATFNEKDFRKVEEIKLFTL